MHSNIRIDTRGYEIMRVLPKINEFINDEFISDKARFAFDGLTNQRLTSPLMKVNNVFVEVSWSKVINTIIEKLITIDRPNKLGVSIGPFCDMNSLVYVKRLVNKFNGIIVSENSEESLDLDFQSSFKFNTAIRNISKSDVCLLVGVNTRTEAALLNYHLRKRYLNGGLCVGYIGSHLNLTFPTLHLGTSVNKLVTILEGKHSFCKLLKKANNPCIIVGKSFINSLKKNSLNVLLNGFRQNIDIIKGTWHGLNLLNVQSSDYCRYDLGLRSVSTEQNFDFLYLLGKTNYISKELTSKFTVYQGHHGCLNVQSADIILPTYSFMEKAAVFGNLEGNYQSTQSVTLPLGDSRDDWKIIYAIYNGFFDLPFMAISLTDILPTTGSVVNNTVNSFFTWSSYIYKGVIINDLYLPSGVFDNFYKTDIVSESSLNMSKCSTQLLHKNPFKL